MKSILEYVNDQQSNVELRNQHFSVKIAFFIIVM